MRVSGRFLLYIHARVHAIESNQNYKQKLLFAGIFHDLFDTVHEGEFLAMRKLQIYKTH